MDRAALADLFAEFGAVDVKRMFSGFGIYADGVLIGVALKGSIFLVADDETIPDFVAEGAHCFQYAATKRTVSIKRWWSLPARLYDDPDELARWARGALAAARRTSSVKPAKKRSSPAGQVPRKERAGTKAKPRRRTNAGDA